MSDFLLSSEEHYFMVSLLWVVIVLNWSSSMQRINYSGADKVNWKPQLLWVTILSLKKFTEAAVRIVFSNF